MGIIQKSTPQNHREPCQLPVYRHPDFITGQMPLLSPNQQCQSTEGSPAYTDKC